MAIKIIVETDDWVGDFLITTDRQGLSTMDATVKSKTDVPIEESEIKWKRLLEARELIEGIVTRKHTFPSGPEDLNSLDDLFQ